MRESGILLPVSSLPSRYGIGCFDRCAYKFGRWYDMVWMEKHLAPHENGPWPMKTPLGR